MSRFKRFLAGLLAVGAVIGFGLIAGATLSRIYDRVTGGVIDADKDDAELDNIYTELSSHAAALNPHTNSLDATGDTMTGTLIMDGADIKIYDGNDLKGYSDNGTTLKYTIDGATGDFTAEGAITASSISKKSGRVKIGKFFPCDSGSEPDAGLYTLSIGGVNYYVQTIDMAQNEMVCFKQPIPDEYTAGEQIFLRVGYASAGSAVAYTFDNYFGLLDDGDVIDTSLHVATDSARTLTSPATANEMEYDNTSVVTNASGQIDSVAVATGDVIIGKIKRTNVDANDFRLISLEMTW